LRRALGVELKTSGGDIRVADLDGNATARTSSGSINLAKVTGRVETSDSGGDYTEPDGAIPHYGRIGLQIHGGSQAEVFFRKITIVERP
jgi:hypothetical protein